MGYPGGKAAAGVFQKIINHFPPHEVYIEPFLGGGAILQAKRPAVVNIGLDLSRSAVELVASELARTAAGWFATVRDRSGKVRSGQVTSGEGGSLVRLAENGEGRGFPRASPDVAMGAGAAGRFLLLASLSNLGPNTAAKSGERRRLDPLAAAGEPKSYFLYEGDALEFLARYPWTGRELVYCDPPYMLMARRGGEIYSHEMDLDAHGRLLALLRKLPCMVLISGYASPLYTRELKGWNVSQFQVMTRGGPAVEFLWFNFSRPVALHEYTFLGEGFRERERIKRKKQRWVRRLASMPDLERQALLAAIAALAENGGQSGSANIAAGDDATRSTPDFVLKANERYMRGVSKGRPAPVGP